MERKAFGFLRKVFVSCLKKRTLEKIPNNFAQPKARFCSSNVIAPSFNCPQFQNLTSANAQNLVLPSLLKKSVYNETIIKLRASWNVQNDSSKQTIRPTLKFSPHHPSIVKSSLKEPVEIPLSSQYSEDKPLLKMCLMDEVQGNQPGSNKVTVIGSGNVGVACAVCILQQQITHQLCIVCTHTDKALGEITDLKHASTFMSKLHLCASADYEATVGTKIFIYAPEMRGKAGQSSLDVLDTSVQAIKESIPPLVKYSPTAVFIIVANPVDILTYVAWKLSGLPKGRVFGTGCEIDTSRFRVFLGEKLGLAPCSCHGWIIGEHGDTSVPVWSSVNVAGVKFMDLNPCIGAPHDPENWVDLHQRVLTCGAEVTKLKNHASWAIGMTAAVLTHAVLNNLGTVHSVSLSAKGYQNIEDDVFLSLPASVGLNGINSIIKQTLTDSEMEQLHKSAGVLKSKQDLIKL